MNLRNLYSLQKTLDQKINTTHNIINMQLTNKKILALNVEVAELANETRCFKFWTLKGPSEKDVIIEEFVDCLHFILSVGLDLKFTDTTIDELSIQKDNFDITEMFLNIFTIISKLSIDKSRKTYIDLFSTFLTLGYNLGFSSEDIEKAYLSKNVINHQRQDNGY